jgi:hypothetical protein
MANVGLDRAHPQRITHCSVLAEDIANGPGLDGIADSRASAVGFDEAARIGVEARLAINLSHKILCEVKLASYPQDYWPPFPTEWASYPARRRLAW